MVGYDAIVALAKGAGMNENIRPTPAVALGAYAVTDGTRWSLHAFCKSRCQERPTFISSVLEPDGTSLYQPASETKRVLDPRVAFLLVDMCKK